MAYFIALKKNCFEFYITLLLIFALIPSISFLLVAASVCLLKERKVPKFPNNQGAG